MAIVRGQSQTNGKGGGLDPKAIYAPLRDSWSTYSGDYSGKRYSALTQLNHATVKSLSLAWTMRLTAGPGGGGGRGGGGGAAVIVGGEGSGEFGAGGAANIKGSILQVGGILYVSAPDNAWAIDARDGREIWRYYWKTRGGTHIGNRGLGMWGNYLYMETPDNYLVSLDARTGKERWHKVISSFEQQYFSTMAPIVVDNHVLVGTGNDLDAPGFLQSFDPETGALQWKLYTVPMNPGDPGLETWKDLRSTWRRTSLGAGLVRSGNALVHHGHWKSDSCLYLTGARPRRQPVHLFADRRERRHRQDAVVLPDVATRHTRLGFRPDAGAR
ncbi:MAG: PQQ-binding-like beta-propeller repeat protein [Vicinamibacterales bacterium]